MNRFNISDFIRTFLPQFGKQEETKGIISPHQIRFADSFTPDGIDDDEPELLEKAAEEDKDDELDEFLFVDLTNEKKTKKRGESQGHRKWKNIKGITLHQTAADFGSNPMRLLNVPVHGATLRDGKIVLIHTPTDYMWHAHSLNRYDVGIEVSCRAAGIEGNGKTFWRSKSDKEKGKTYEQLVKEATDIQLEATKELCRYYINLVAENGGKIEFIHAHRQGHKSRVSDPGSRIWENVAIPVMEEFGLTSGPVGWKSGSGTAIPQIWDPVRGKGIPYSGNVKGL